MLRWLGTNWIFLPPSHATNHVWVSLAHLQPLFAHLGDSQPQKLFLADCAQLQGGWGKLGDSREHFGNLRGTHVAMGGISWRFFGGRWKQFVLCLKGTLLAGGFRV